MDGLSLKSRAVAFALCSGAVVFILALLAGAPGSSDPKDIGVALVIAIVCGVMSWGSAERAIAGTAEAVDAMAERIGQAAEGDLVSPTPAKVLETLPELAVAMETLFSQVRANLDSVHALAMYDTITALPNRINFRREADRMLAAIPEGAGAILLFIDLDRFKFVNDSLGHACGDELLVMVANRMKAVAARIDQDDMSGIEPMVARLGGDEFTLFCAMSEGGEQAARIARRVLFALSEPFLLAGQSLDVGASIGVATYPDHGRDLTTLMRAADIAMYHAKAQGRGQAQIFAEELAHRFEDRLQLDRELRHALDRGEFELVFQPQVRLASKSAVAAEALIRWNHPTAGVRMPGSFIAAAEESGLILDIGDWVLEESLRTLATWSKSGFTQRMALNVSPRQIERPDFFGRLRASLIESGVDPKQVELELTETMAMQCSPAVLAGITMLRAEGVAIAIDDFGTGYSNLARLKDLPLDRVKLDRSLIEDIARSDEARTLAHSVINLIHGLGFEVVAEGVEEEDQMSVLRAIGCDLVQGYRIAQPMGAAAFREWIGHAARQAANA